jgi:hypothetical protein
MKKLIFIVMMLNLSFVFAHEKGNGGGGVNENGVYRTFYSAGVIVNPRPETEVPGAKLYLKTINSLVENGETASELISNALPMRDRLFYRVKEESMGKDLMDRLLEEYERVSGQPKNQLTIFAITDIAKKTTYLLPSFYKLSEVEQAAILFHEAFWIIRPESDYSEVIRAEMAFQEFVEKTKKGKASVKLPRLLGETMGKRNIAFNYAIKMDAQTQSAPDLIDPQMKVSIRNLFVEDKCEVRTKTYSLTLSVELEMRASCKYTWADTQDLIALSEKYPDSLLVKEIIEYVDRGNTFMVSKGRTVVVSKFRVNKTLAKFKDDFFAKYVLNLK